MSINRREEVLDRLKAIMEAQEGYETTFRNRSLLSNDNLPALGLLDGDESSRIGTPAPRGRPGFAASIVTMNPQIFIVVKNKKPANKDIGTLLNTLRGKLISAIAADALLLALIGPNGRLNYDGAETDLKTGMPLEGQMQINLSIDVPFDPRA